MLFQGARLCRQHIPSVATGCEGALDSHFLSADTALFGSNNLPRAPSSEPGGFGSIAEPNYQLSFCAPKNYWVADIANGCLTSDMQLAPKTGENACPF